ncbi:MAG: hypothetical protein JWP14_1283 [Frankiales bacterium]|nr:hypothetical protein [Frankiales bacterium]
MWKPDPAWIWAQLGLAAVLFALLPVVDHLGWVILVPAALAAAASGLRDLLLTPVLTANASGLAVVDGVRRVGASWADVHRLRTVRDRRTPLLELDVDGHVVVLSQRRLGAPVEEVLADLERLRVS